MPNATRQVCQISGVMLLLSMLFLTLGVLSYSPQDPSWNHFVQPQREAVHNLGGFLGASLADWGLQLFGCTVLLVIGIGTLEAGCLIRGRWRVGVEIALCGSLCLIALSTAAHLFFTHDPVFDTVGLPGGFSGEWLADRFDLYLHRGGTYAVVAALLLATLIFTIKRCLPIRQAHDMVESRAGSRSRAALWLLAICGGGRISRGWLSRLMSLSRHSLAGKRPGAEPAVGDKISTEIQEHSCQECEDIPAAPTSSPLHKPLVIPLSVMAQPEEDTLDTFPGVPAVMIASQELAGAPVMTCSTERSDVQDKQGDTAAASLPPALPHIEALEETPVSAELSSHGPDRPVPSIAPPAAPEITRQIRLPLPGAARREGAAASQSGQRRSPLYAMHVPSPDILDASAPAQDSLNSEELAAQARFLEQKLREFGVDGEVVQVLPGPVITMYEFAPAAGVKVSKIVNLQDDLALVMRALSVRVVAPVPGKAVVGIEIPNRRRAAVVLRDILDTETFQHSASKLSMALGADTLGKPVVVDLALIPHLLVAGATGSGKSVGLNSLICSLLFRATPAEVKMLMIDPKMLEFSIYDGIPHLLVPVVTDAKKAAVALRRVVAEMERRYQLLAARGVRSIAQYNQAIEEETAAVLEASESVADSGAERPACGAEKLPYLVVIIDELSDLMMVSSREVEDALMRIAQMARAAGIHLIVATQRPSVDVLTGVIKANFPARLSFQVTSKTDSRTILDTNGAETLLGRGDMLFLAPGTSKPQRIHGAYVSEAEIHRLVDAWKSMASANYDESFLQAEEEKTSLDLDEYDEKYDEAIALVAKTGQASISMLQRRLRVGYNRAARMIEIMEKEGVVGPSDGVKPREVLVRNTFEEG